MRAANVNAMRQGNAAWLNVFAALTTRNLTATASATTTTLTLPFTHHGARTTPLSPVSRAAPYGASAIIGELRCLFGGASADQSRLAARLSPVLAFVSLLAVTAAAVLPRGIILRARSHRPRRACVPRANN